MKSVAIPVLTFKKQYILDTMNKLSLAKGKFKIFFIFPCTLIYTKWFYFFGEINDSVIKRMLTC